ncbi:hypothetical protein QR685DRAFT_243626 [Neurospora intermedia]|uniref:Secreted protein n=1 Tax=Neurospora intermedia TaxID=5142 RepID=A0ABR3DBL1_NEUIN
MKKKKKKKKNRGEGRGGVWSDLVVLLVLLLLSRRSSWTTRFGLRRGWYRVPTVKQRESRPKGCPKGEHTSCPSMDWMWVRCLHGLVASQNGALTR